MSTNRKNKSYVVTKRTFEKISIGKKSLLTTLDVELTERCNNNCIHCLVNLHEDDIEAKQKELSTQKIKDIISEATKLGALSIRFTGGEPLLHKDFEEIYLHARKSGLKVLLFTNATRISKKLTDLFQRIPPLEKIEVSIYGMTRQSYEAVSRIPGSFDAAWNGINLLLEKKIPFIVKGILLPQNKKDRLRFESWASSLPWMDRSPSYSMFFDLRCRRDSNEKNRIIKRLRMSAHEGFNILAADPSRYFNDMKRFCSKYLSPPGDRLFACGAGLKGGCVDPYGFIYPCIPLRQPGTGYDLKKGTLKDALADFFPNLRKIRSKNPRYLSTCARCFLKGLCEQCPAKSHMENGTLDTPVEYHCEIAHAQARYLGLLDPNEQGWEVRDWQKRIAKFSNNKGTRNALFRGFEMDAHKEKACNPKG